MFRPPFKTEGILIVLVLWTVEQGSKTMLIFLQGIEIKWNESRWICPSSEPLDTILCFSEYPNYFQVVWHTGNLCASFSAYYLEAVSQVGIVLWTIHLCMHYFTLNSSNILLKVNLVKWIQYTYFCCRDSACGCGQAKNWKGALRWLLPWWLHVSCTRGSSSRDTFAFSDLKQLLGHSVPAKGNFNKYFFLTKYTNSSLDTSNAKNWLLNVAYLIFCSIKQETEACIIVSNKLYQKTQC